MYLPPIKDEAATTANGDPKPSMNRARMKISTECGSVLVSSFHLQFRILRTPVRSRLKESTNDD